jgi:transposase
MTQVTLLTGRERRRRWSPAERATILAAAFAPGSVVADVARQFEVSTSLIYKWRRDHLPASEGFSRVVLAEAPGRRDVGSHEPVILVELDQVRVSIGASAPASLVTATLRALR